MSEIVKIAVKRSAVDVTERADLIEFGMPAEQFAFELEFQPKARRTDPDTSWSAANRIASKASTHRLVALKALGEAGAAGLTDFELADRVGIAQTSIGVRRGELVRAGLVEKTAMRRPSPSGSPSIVWRIT